MQMGHIYPGGTQVWFWLGCVAGNLKVDPYKYQFSKKKVTQSYTNWLNLWSNLTKVIQLFIYFFFFFQILLDLSQFWLKFGNILKIDPFTYTKFLHKIRYHWYTRRLILLPMFGTRRVFCTPLDFHTAFS